LAVGDDGGPGAKGAKAMFLFLFLIYHVAMVHGAWAAVTPKRKEMWIRLTKGGQETKWWVIRGGGGERGKGKENFFEAIKGKRI